MKNKYLKTILAGSLLPILLASLTGCSDRYARANNLEGEQLKNVLREICDHKTPLGYDDLASYYTKTDPADEKGKITLFYTGQVVSTNMADPDYYSYGSGDDDINREHVWCQSRFRVYGSMSNPAAYGTAVNPGPATDLYNVRPCLGIVNVDRSNYFYVDGAERGTSTYDPVTWEEDGKAEFRGEIARILFYCATRYEKLTLVEATNAHTGVGSHEMGQLSTLLKWNLENEVNNREMIRNDEVEKIQGNRNPFVDHPEYACKIWGNTNDATKAACGLK